MRSVSLPAWQEAKGKGRGALGKGREGAHKLEVKTLSFLFLN